MPEPLNDASAEAAAPPAEMVPAPPPVGGEPAHGGVSLRSAIGAKLSAAMFLHHFTLGAWIVTLSTYVEANTGTQGKGIFAAGFVGIAYSAGPIGGMLAPFLTGVLADNFFATERIMAVLNLIGAAALGFAVAADSQNAFYVALFVHFLCFIPSFALLSSMTFHHLARPERDFPVARSCSTAGWVAAGLVVGWVWPTLTGHGIEGTATPMKIAMAAELATAVFCLLLPHTPPANKRGDAAAGGFSAAQTLSLLREPRFLLLMALAVLAHVPPQFYYSYLNVYLNTWVDWPYAASKMALGQIVEVACMVLLPAILLRMSVKTAILLGLAVWTVRFGVISASASAAGATQSLYLYAAILVHGVAFTLVSIPLQLDVDRCAGRRRRATGQGMLSVCMNGMGSFIGAELAGLAGARLLPLKMEAATASGWASFWLVPGAIMAGIFLVTAVFLPADIRGPASLESSGATPLLGGMEQPDKIPQTAQSK